MRCIELCCVLDLVRLVFTSFETLKATSTHFSPRDIPSDEVQLHVVAGSQAMLKSDLRISSDRHVDHFPNQSAVM
eukprot:5998296-Pyramimonas_sp.AAC.2